MVLYCTIITFCHVICMGPLIWAPAPLSIFHKGCIPAMRTLDSGPMLRADASFDQEGYRGMHMTRTHRYMCTRVHVSMYVLRVCEHRCMHIYIYIYLCRYSAYACVPFVRSQKRKCLNTCAWLHVQIRMPIHTHADLHDVGGLLSVSESGAELGLRSLS